MATKWSNEANNSAANLAEKDLNIWSSPRYFKTDDHAHKTLNDKNDISFDYCRCMKTNANSQKLQMGGNS